MSLRNFLISIMTLSLLVLLVFAGTQNPSAVKGHQPHIVGVPQGWSPSDEDSSIFYANFENGLGDWTTVDVTATSSKWHIDDYNAYQGHSWWCADTVIMGYDNHWLQYLITPTLDFSTATSPLLTFKLFYYVETPGGEPPPYDGWDGCNVWLSTDDGVTWSVITPTTPAYNCQNLYSFGVEWGMGPGIAGWGGSSGGWVDASFSLASAVGYSQVKVRFAMCSDPAVCTVSNPELIGMFVDNVTITSGATTLLSNNADDPPYPSEFTFATGEPSGDFWGIDSTTYHSPTHCATCNIRNHFNLSDALVTPWIHLPEGYSIYYTFWLWCDMLDWDGDNDGYLDDYYHVEGTTDGTTWDTEGFGFYDYGEPGRPGAASTGWEEYLPGDPYNGNVNLDLTAYAGQDIKLRFRVTTDANNDGGIGSGLHIDDFNIWVSSLFNNDVGVVSLEIPFPTSLSNASITGTATLFNFGMLDQSIVPAFARMDSASTIPLIPWANIPSQQSVEKTFAWQLSATGNYYWDAYTSLPSDENTANDTATAAYVTVTPIHSYELGYDARQYTLPNATFFYWSFDPGDGALVRFVPADHSLPEAIDIVQAKMLFYSTGPCNLTVFDEGTATQPGAEIYTTAVTVNQTFPNWMTVNLSTVTALRNRTTPFWIWIESTNSNLAQITGDYAHFGAGHYFTYNGTSAQASTLYEFYIRVMAQQAVVGVDKETNLAPATYALYQNSPNPFNPETIISFSLAEKGMTRISIYNSLGEMVKELVNEEMEAGVHQLTFNAENLSSGIYFYRLEAGDFKAIKKMVLMR